MLIETKDQNSNAIVSPDQKKIMVTSISEMCIKGDFEVLPYLEDLADKETYQ